MGMSAEQKAVASERMKALHAAGKLKKSAAKPVVVRTPAVASIGLKVWSIVVSVDWNNLPMSEAQQAYAMLQKELEKAGYILNQRSMPAPGQYICFICQQSHLGDARGTDYSYIDPRTKLPKAILICGERDWIAYQDFRISCRNLRQQRNEAPISDEEYAALEDKALADIRKKYQIKIK